MTLPNCPICHSFSVKLKYEFTSHNYFACRQCTVEFLFPFPTSEEIMSLYKNEDYFKKGNIGTGYEDYTGELRGYELTFRKKIKYLVSIGCTSKSKILEIGPGPGIFLKELREMNFQSVMGLELNPYALDEMHKAGIHAVQGTINNLPREEKYDLIVMLDVFEHILSPEEFLKDLKEHLNLNGLLLITTPVTDSLLCRFSGKNWVSYKIPEHFLLYNRAALKNMLAKSGFHIVSMKSTIQYVSLRFILKRIHTLSGIFRLFPILSNIPGFLSVIIPITSGSVDVIARLSSRDNNAKKS